VALGLFEALLAVWLAVGVFDDCVLLWDAELSSLRCGAAEGVGAVDVVPLLLAAAGFAVAAAALPSTNAPKPLLACDGSDLPGLCDATWKDGLADTSDVTLTTGGPLAMKLGLKVSKDRATRRLKKISIYFNILNCWWEAAERTGALSFSAQRQDLPFAPQRGERHLPRKNTAYIREQLFNLFRNGGTLYLAFDTVRDRTNDRNHAQQSGP
jgi:hypothetical protein